MMPKFVSSSVLKQRGVVGMNYRNIALISANNPRNLFPLVDDKLKTKIIAQEAGIAVPKLVGVVKVYHHIKQLESFLHDTPQFVMKPAKGSGGKGILVVKGQRDGGYVKSSGQWMDAKGLHRHASNILSGLFSLGGQPDVAMIEEMVQFSDVFDGFTYQGVPDIRIIVYRGVPVMSMARLSTAVSDGKANLHQGAVGVGIRIRDGKAANAVQFDLPVSHHPDTNRDLSELAVPHWREVLSLSARCADVTGLGYLGVDIVLDKEKGPLILELNARPGLAIQIANGCGLLPRIEAINNANIINCDVEQRIDWAQTNFL